MPPHRMQLFVYVLPPVFNSPSSSAYLSLLWLDVYLHSSLPPTFFHLLDYIQQILRQFMVMSCQHLPDTPSGVEGELLLLPSHCCTFCLFLSVEEGRLTFFVLFYASVNLMKQVQTHHICKCICKNSDIHMSHFMNNLHCCIAFKVSFNSEV